MRKTYKKPFHVRFTSHLREWHRRLGISAAVFILLLSFSGLILNHSDDMGLPNKAVNTAILLDLYHIQNPTSIISFQVGSAFLVQTDTELWLDNKWLGTERDSLKSAVLYQNFILAIIGESLYIYTPRGDFVDKMDSSLGLPKNMDSLALYQQKIVVRSDDHYWQSDEELTQWTVLSPSMLLTPPLEWNHKINLAVSKKNQFQHQYRAKLLNLERVVLDFHSGRLIGKLGVFFSDIVAILLVLLSVSGIYFWLKRAKQQKNSKTSSKKPAKSK